MENRPNIQEFIRRAKERTAQMSAKPAAEKPAVKPPINCLAALLNGSADGITIKSSTPGNDKRFRITVDDSGVISAAEIK